MTTENMSDPRCGCEEDAISFLVGRVLGMDGVCRYR